eukprot:SAG11_NODE_711_length_7641_cov_103.798064_7_plen_109_part_00
MAEVQSNPMAVMKYMADPAFQVPPPRARPSCRRPPAPPRWRPLQRALGLPSSSDDGNRTLAVQEMLAPMMQQMMGGGGGGGGGAPDMAAMMAAMGGGMPPGGGGPGMQ